MTIDYDKSSKLAVIELPNGYRYRFYQDGDAAYWADIETSVLEFSSKDKAIDYYMKTFLPYEEEMKRRCVFIINPAGLPIATATGWFTEDRDTPKSLITWVAVDPEYQGLGLGEAVVRRAIKACIDNNIGENIWLHTQTWSYVAVGLYHKLGFNVHKSLRPVWCNGDKANRYDNDYIDAIEILKTKLSPKIIKSIEESAID